MLTASLTGVTLGSEALVASSRLRGAVVGVVCNHASVGHGLAHVVDQLAAADGVRLGAVFGPQHGFRSDVQDNMIETPHADDPRMRVPIYSLYSDTREPTAGHAARADAYWWWTCRTSAPASTPTSTRWPTACAPARGTACR